ncbi:MAG TPA: hypothetical protein VNW73_16025 [Ktedonobacteraceae bacterium]|nr:hypothetical protein [Ktedonobacteraceae bacterium]
MEARDTLAHPAKGFALCTPGILTGILSMSDLAHPAKGFALCTPTIYS